MPLLVKQFTGFQSVKHNIQFQPESPRKGKALYESGHVRNVSEFSQCIEAAVVKTTDPMAKPYVTKLLVKYY